MATSIWDPAQRYQIETPNSGGPQPAGVQDMALVRRFVSDVLRREGEPELSDAEWASLCGAGGSTDSSELAISRIVLGAYALRTPTADPTRTAPMDDRRLADDPDRSEPPVVAAVSTVPDGACREPTDALDGLLIPSNFAPADTRVEPAASWIPLDLDSAGPEEAPTGAAAFPEVAISAWALVAPEPSPEARPEQPAPPARRAGRHRPARRRVRLSRGVRPAGRPVRLSDRRRDRLIIATSWVRNIGAIILLFVAWQLWGTAITQHHTQSALKSQFESKFHHPATKPGAGFTLIPASTRIPDPPDGTAMANLQIPKIDLNEFVVSGTDEGDLAKGPGHYLGTAMPGQAGNVAIAGHRTTHGAPFNRLAELAVGDPIYLTTPSGQELTYIVSAAPVAVSPKDVTVLNNFGDDRLTLTTCNPEYSAVQRLIVVAAYLPPGATHPTALTKGTGNAYALAPAETSGWNTTLLPLVALEVLALVGLGLGYRKLSRVYGRGTRWLILAPVWVALLIALFETLTNFLPAAV